MVPDTLPVLILPDLIPFHTLYGHVVATPKHDIEVVGNRADGYRRTGNRHVRLVSLHLPPIGPNALA